MVSERRKSRKEGGNRKNIFLGQFENNIVPLNVFVVDKPKTNFGSSNNNITRRFFEYYDKLQKSRN